MGIIGRFRRDHSAPEMSAGTEPGGITSAAIFRGGNEDLEVVGEARYQEHLWASARASIGDEVRFDIIATLVPEPKNAYDENAVSVQIDGRTVGYLARATAQAYLPGLRKLMETVGGHVALRGVIVGGGQRADGPGMLGVWLRHDPRDFGVAVARDGAMSEATMRTGFSDALLTDLADDSYDLSWFSDLSEDDMAAIAMLRTLLETDPDPIDRHFQFAELEARLYRCRNLYEAALDEYDDACQRHDAEMEGICQAFIAKWGKIPLLDTYRQMAIRQQKKKDWAACIWWAERGLALYGDNPARPSAVDDLKQRLNRAQAKLPRSSPQTG